MAPHEVECAHHASQRKANKKRLVICCDGTWNNANLGSGPPTNVSRLSGAVAHKCCTGMPQIVYYHSGAGTETSKVAHVLGGAFGIGVAQDIVESYRFVCDNYNPGDEIIIIGFSRGAFTARSVAAMICALGFLNRPGLDHLPYIFRDYETWQKWGKTDFDEKRHLVGFTVENVKKLRRFQATKKARGQSVRGPSTPEKSWERWGDGELAEKLKEWKQATFLKMAGMTKERNQKATDARKMAETYQNILAEFDLSSCEEKPVPGSKDVEYVPIKGHVKAVGVWDTVGSLGIPNIAPFYHSGRDEQEIQFDGLDVHERVEHAFHAIALDEWRTAFNCTMWGKKGNTKTQLRQVWFPGSHSNVGGGWEDQQIATIALAWMADQLTSVGVEFSRTEMNRIFHDMRPEAKARPWGMGLIRNPESWTSYPDWLWTYAAAPWRKLKGRTTDYITRTPGNHKEDDGEEQLVDCNELVHPCVRIRYLYGGLNLDDAGPWTCRPLTEHGYTLQRRIEPLSSHPLKSRIDTIAPPLDTYHSVRGRVTPYLDVHPPITTAGTDENPFVRVEQPHESDLYPIPAMPSSGQAPYWEWAHKKRSPLAEEQIGMWERRYIKVNEKLVAMQEKLEGPPPNHNEAEKGYFASIKSYFSGEPEPPKIKAVELKDASIPQTYGYHDFFTWQKGDTREKRPRV